MDNPSFTIRPGAAFGSGSHPSTQGALTALERLRSRIAPAYVLDMGCGAGTLSLAAASLWPEARVVAADIAPEAVEAASRNASANGLEARIRVLRSDGYGEPVITTQGPYDLILCNILAEPIIRMAHDLGRHLADAGIAVLAGILPWLEAEVLAAHRAAGLASLETLAQGSWNTLILQKTAIVTKA